MQDLRILAVINKKNSISSTYDGEKECNHRFVHDAESASFNITFVQKTNSSKYTIRFHAAIICSKGNHR